MDGSEAFSSWKGGHAMTGCLSDAEVPFYAAISLCSRNGARLCAPEELPLGCTTGCNHDSRRVWAAPRIRVSDDSSGYGALHEGKKCANGGRIYIGAWYKTVSEDFDCHMLCANTPHCTHYLLSGTGWQSGSEMECRLYKGPCEYAQRVSCSDTSCRLFPMYDQKADAWKPPLASPAPPFSRFGGCGGVQQSLEGHYTIHAWGPRGALSLPTTTSGPEGYRVKIRRVSGGFYPPASTCLHPP